MRKEGEPQHDRESEERLPAFQLPADLAYALKDEDYACVTTASSEGTVHVIKVQGEDIAGIGDRVPLRVRHELYTHPLAPVVRTVLTIYDQPDRPLAVETFINVTEADQRADFAALGEQEELHLLFYDEDLQYQKGITVPNSQRDAIPSILHRADSVRDGIPAGQYDFDAAKDAVMQITTLS